MTEIEKIQAAANFSRDWSGSGYEKGETQKFWTQLLRDVFEVDKPENFISPEERLKIGGTTYFIDILIRKTKVLIEQKSFGVDLDSAFEQAKFYAENLPYSERPRWIVTCNFSEFRIYNLDCMNCPDKYRQLYIMNHENDFTPPTAEDIENAVTQPRIIKLENLRYDYKNLNFIVDENIEMISPDVQISIAAADIVSKIRDSFIKNYEKNSVRNYQAYIYKICTRLVFCLYAGDSHIFADNQFADYLNSFDTEDRLAALQKLFTVLNTKENLRDDNLPDNLKNFQYVNGGLFAENFDLPKYKKFIENPVDILLTFNANKNFSWHMINPTIFGAMFESALNPDTQRTGGMYYTSPDNIHKVIDPLFFNRLHEHFNFIKRSRIKNRLPRLLDLQNKLASLKFLDPACGSGNFLTETYLSLRKLENDILREIKKFTALPANPVKVSINQFYGIEINDFACAVAQVALWIAENQMLQETEAFLDHDLNALPLKNYPNIINANALKIDWNKIISPQDLNFIIGNPPFVGFTYQNYNQKSEMQNIFPGVRNLDYVCAWYKKADDFIKNTKIECAFLSTNSITQGETVERLWQFLDSKINFAHRTFKWENESLNPSAAVHCVIISFADFHRDKKIIFDGNKKIFAKNINPYLLDAPNILVTSRNKSLCDVPQMIYGNKPADGGFLILSDDEKNYFIEKYPESDKFIRPLLGADEFLNGKQRFCFWFVNYSLDEIKKFPEIYNRVEKVKKFRLASKKIATKKSAETPQLFQEIRRPEKNYILVPRHSSENRKYIPIDWVDKNVICSDANFIIPDAEIYHFGILQSSVHMAWVRAVCGRLESRYRYSKDIVYNNFVWCEPTAMQRKKIEETAAKILEVRRKYNWTLAKLYNESTMPGELRLAHEENDRAVMAAYGFAENLSEEEILAALMNLYKNLTEK